MLLGNLSTLQMQSRLGIRLTDAEIETLEERRQNKASYIAKDKWHCFDMPFTIVCGSRETATKIHQILLPYSSEMKTQIGIAIEG